MPGDPLLSFSSFLSNALSMEVGDTNHDIYDKRLTSRAPWPLFNYTPRCVYFYYVKLTDGKIKVDHYIYDGGPDPHNQRHLDPIPHGSMRAIVAYLALNARLAANQDPQPLGDHNFENIKWTRRSYIAIFVDESDWFFHRNGANNAAVSFNVAKGSTPNHSFFDAEDMILNLPDPQTGVLDSRSAIYFVNHMKKNADGDELNGDEEYKFDMHFSVKFADPSVSHMTVILDPGGTNSGPPEQPDP